MSLWQQRERARVILSKETGYVIKPQGARLRVALAFPNTYWVGMSNLGFQTVYRLFNDQPDISCERVFLPPKQELAELVASRTPLVTLESQSLVGEFDAIAFSVSFEWDYVNVLTLLRLAGVPSYAAERTERHPLVVVGGAVTFVNPEPLAPFADVIAAGEGEVLVPAMARAFSEASGRRDLLTLLARERGFYIPSFYEPQYALRRLDVGLSDVARRRRARCPCARRRSRPRRRSTRRRRASSRLTPNSDRASSSRSSEAARTCAASAGPATTTCRSARSRPSGFCSSPRSARVHANRVGLVSIALCDHPDIERILARLHEMGYGISPASLRLDDITEPIVRILRESGERTITIAPETGSDRLRRVINKTVTNDEILDRADLIFASGLENLKLYYMIGLPTETDDDLVAIRDLTLQLRERMLKYAKPRGSIGRIIGSVNPLIPKPGTAYQWLPMEDDASVDRKIKRLRGLMAGIDNVYFNIKSERHSYYQALLSLGDRRVAPAIVAAERNGQNWRAAVAETGLDADFYIFRDRTKDAVLPWDIIDGGMKASFFHSEFDKSLREEWTLPPKRQQENARLLPVIN